MERITLTEKVIELINVSKSFRNKPALRDLNFHIDAHKTYGFSGPNGSGKTLTFKTILGFSKATTGQVIVNGDTIRKDTLFASNIGFAIPEYGVLPNKSGAENLKLLSILAKSDENQVASLLSYVGLDPTDTQYVKSYSLGMRQRLLISAALIADNPTLIFDEPTNALDESGQQFMVNLINDLKSKGKTILVSSHDSTFLKRISDKIFYFNEGQIVREAEQ
jgi:ABC-2 type transport system ATP-binding protein